MEPLLQSAGPMSQVSAFEYHALRQPTSASFPVKGTAAVETHPYVHGPDSQIPYPHWNRKRIEHV